MNLPMKTIFYPVLLLCALLTAGGAYGNPLPLGKVPVPEPANLSQFVKDRQAAIALGKALFWEMQAGSDGIQACASCHFDAGADSRLTNALNPGPALPPAAAPLFDIGGAPNYTLQPGDFPFFQVSPVDGRLGIDPVTGLPLDPNAVVVRNLNDIGGSQGLPLADFLAVNAGAAAETGSAGSSPLFGPSRQVTGRNAPSVINAVFNYTNFWDGRANNVFNGENPLGPLDVAAGIWVDDGVSGSLVKQRIAIANASLASQAVGPPRSGVDMSFAGRSFPELGRKLLSLTPLGRQLVHPNDGVLGALSRAELRGDGTLAGQAGLSGSYPQMIRDAFQDNLWSSAKTVTLPAGAGEQNPQFSQMEANFPLFWGLAIQLYEATLISDRTPFDRFLSGNGDALSAAAQNGFATFVDKCAVCHAGSELTAAAVGHSAPFCAPPDCNPAVFANNSSHQLIRTDVDPVTFTARLADAGFFNIGVRPTQDDPGRGAADGFPLSFTRLARLAQLSGLPFVTPKLPAGASPAAPTAVDGAFKVPGLRNVELTAPYFHNGSMLTLDQVLEFYTRGGNFPANPELSAAMQPMRNLRGKPDKRAEVVAFLRSLTDERVRSQSAPFDHPQLMIPSGDAADTLVTLPATGGAPPALAPELAIGAVPSPTVAGAVTFGGSVAPLSTVEVAVNGAEGGFATVTGTAWSVTVALPVGAGTVRFTAQTPSGGSQTLSVAVLRLPVAVIGGLPPGGRSNQNTARLTIGGSGVASYRYALDGGPLGPDTPVAQPILLAGLSDATHSIAVLGKDAAGNEQPAASATLAGWTVKANPPLLTLAPPVSPASARSQTIGGSVELGSTPTVSVAPPAQAGAVTTRSGNGVASWSCTLTGLAEGENRFSVTALDFVFNVSQVSGVITVDTVAPALTLDPIAPVRGRGATLTGSVEGGLVPRVAVTAPALAGGVAVIGGSWSCPVAGLAPGDNPVTVTATDPAGNVRRATGSVKSYLADGNFRGTGDAGVADALSALRIAVGLVQPTVSDLAHGDVAPLLNGIPAPNGRIDLADALMILRKVVGLVSF